MDMRAMHSHHSRPNGGGPGAKSRDLRICDACGKMETPVTGRFRICGGCLVTQYCTTDCQRKHWPTHKPLCTYTAAQFADVRNKAVPHDCPTPHLAKHLRKFCSTHLTLLSWAVFQALQVRRMPSNVRNQLLLVELAYEPKAPGQLALINTHVVPKSYMEASADPLVLEDVAKREQRCRKAGGVGAAVVLIQCGGVCEVIPVELDAPSQIPWEMHDDWEDVLDAWIESGRADFIPPRPAPVSRPPRR